MRSVLAVAALAATLALGPAAASADEAIGVATPVHHHRSPFSIQGFGAGLILDGAAAEGGIELGYRMSPSFQLEVDYGRLAFDDGGDRLGMLGAGVRWLASHGDVTSYLYAGVAVPMAGALPIVDFPVARTGFGLEWGAKHGVFVSGQLGVDLLPGGGTVYPMPEARLGLGVRF